jgi:hypothetical protein
MPINERLRQAIRQATPTVIRALRQEIRKGIIPPLSGRELAPVIVLAALEHAQAAPGLTAHDLRVLAGAIAKADALFEEGGSVEKLMAKSRRRTEPDYEAAAEVQKILSGSISKSASSMRPDLERRVRDMLEDGATSPSRSAAERGQFRHSLALFAMTHGRGGR